VTDIDLDCAGEYHTQRDAVVDHSVNETCGYSMLVGEERNRQHERCCRRTQAGEQLTLVDLVCPPKSNEKVAYDERPHTGTLVKE
jgi:hypothetical protein